MARAVLLVVGLLGAVCIAQDILLQLPSIQNLTVSFFKEGSIANEDSNACPDTESVTFSTGSVPYSSENICYNLHELFAPNNTENNYPANSLSYTLSNIQAWDPTANYSRIRYAQSNATTEDQSGEDAALYFQTYNDLGCKLNRAPGSKFPNPILPWIGWSCQSSSDGGDCYTVPYAIKSFRMGDASWTNSLGQCMNAAIAGTGNRGREISAWGLVVVVGFLAVKLA
ncbi:uncharacterized protein RCC_08189 [Ramularia collo-cygni]|uniref:Uncharacterized protein n=1 Tax=Ramularia collo-cygni TaxID=112498 RepID=A0A2D3VA32_9PEZI|nr:uncharacterized protein RCC_08189 [Ramularia collo-cygni]CZT22320.1 uncharacterized protein RCC_08189 [Ramularia collo-cygni]